MRSRKWSAEDILDLAERGLYNPNQSSKLDEIIDRIQRNPQEPASLARTNFLALIEEVIGPAEPEIDSNRHLVGKIIRNKLRAEQRLRKDAL